MLKCVVLWCYMQFFQKEYYGGDLINFSECRDEDKILIIGSVKCKESEIEYFSVNF